ncbi:MAG: hypothetical protein EAZ99_03825 [Alphaproteobacteria bacterium]|nr:MAG: hypothetical protein EAZ99_03825 [Alphaproteobacteria bacterium]
MIAGCSLPPPEARRGEADRLAQSLRLDPVVLPVTGGPAFAAWRRGQGRVLTVLIEGDGLAWISAREPSADPTPVDPIALRLAGQIAEPVAVLARPCQYRVAVEPACRPTLWTMERFTDATIARHGAAVDRLKQLADADSVVLVGFSGGGTIAAALAAARRDVSGLVTIAAPIDVAGWTTGLTITPLPAPSALTLIPALRHLPQRHIWSYRDTEVPPPTQARLTVALANCPGVLRILNDRRHSGPWTAADLGLDALGRCPG